MIVSSISNIWKEIIIVYISN